MGSSNKKKPKMPTGVSASVGKVGSSQRLQGGVKKSSSKNSNTSNRIYKRCVVYHRFKKEILAPFITKLLIAKRFEDLTENLDSEISVFDPGMSPDSSRRREITLGMITEEDNPSEVSYQEDWRSE